LPNSKGREEGRDKNEKKVGEREGEGDSARESEVRVGGRGGRRR
jgi:hypothetical protein